MDWPWHIWVEIINLQVHWYLNFPPNPRGLHSSISSTAYLHGLLWKAVTPKTNTMARQIMAIPFSFKGSCLSDFIMLPSWNKRLRWTMHCWIWQCSSCESGFGKLQKPCGQCSPSDVVFPQSEHVNIPTTPGFGHVVSHVQGMIRPEDPHISFPRTTFQG